MNHKLPSEIEAVFKKTFLEKNQKPTRQLDALVTEKVMGVNPSIIQALALGPPAYSQDANLFMDLLEKISKMWFVDLGVLPGSCADNPNPKYTAKVWDAEPCITKGVGYTSGLEEYTARASTLSLALCIAALRACQVPEEDIQAALKMD